MSAQVYGQRVGLVLSGGGAKGLAHIGVIKALEENEIPIDYIAGTSMGAIIGGLYAAGYSYEEMMELVSSDDFSRWASGEIDEKYIYYLKKKENNAAQFSIKFTKKGTETRTKLPTNLIPTNPMDFAFMQIFSAPAAIAGYDFDKLFVPFRCVGSDIYNNKSVIFKEGQLSDAIRASMTLPFYFKPITIDSVLYFDGGIYDNFPYQVLIDDFHPDILIGSKTASNTSKPDEDNVLLQIENMIAGITDYSLPDSNGIMVETKFKDIGLLDFSQYDSIVERGYQSALQKMDEIKSNVKRRVSREYRNQLRKTFKNSLPELIFQHIAVNGLDSNQARFIKQSITSDNGYFHVEQFKQKYFELIADDRIESIYPRAIYNEKTKMFELVLKVKKQSPFITQIGGNISSSSLNTGFVGFEWNKLGMIGNTVSANFYYGKFYSSGQIKYVMDFPSFIPFRTTFRAAYNQWDYFSGSNSPFFEDYKPAYLIQKEAHFGFIVSFPAGINRVVKIGTSISQSWDEYYQNDSFTKNDTADITELHLNNLGFSIERNTLNHKQYPTRGKLRQFGAQYVYGDEVHRPGSTSVDENTYNSGQDWYHIRLKNDTYHRIFKNVNMGVHLEGVYSNMKFLRNYTSTMLNAPAFQPFPHSKILFLENYRAHAYLGAGLKPVIQWNSWLHTRVEGYFFVPYQKILQNEQQQAYYGEKFKNFYLMLSSAVVAHTPFGPASISLNYYDKENKKWFVVFNFGYIMFNKKGLEY